MYMNDRMYVLSYLFLPVTCEMIFWFRQVMFFYCNYLKLHASDDAPCGTFEETMIEFTIKEFGPKDNLWLFFTKE